MTMSWKDFVIPVPRPIPPGFMVGMRGEYRDRRYFVIEFLEEVPERQPNPYEGQLKSRTPPPRTPPPRTKRKKARTYEVVSIEWGPDDGVTIVSYDRPQEEGVSLGKRGGRLCQARMFKK